MARSSTSLVVPFVAKKGCYITDPVGVGLQETDKYNLSDYSKANALMDMNRRILKPAGFSSEDTWLHNPISTKQADGIYDLKASDIHNHFVEI